MTVNPGDVVMLKSGGQPLTVVSTSDDEAVCLWIGDEGDLFRETIPLIALTSIDMEEDDEDEDDGADAGSAADEHEEEAETRREREPA